MSAQTTTKFVIMPIRYAVRTRDMLGEDFQQRAARRFQNADEIVQSQVAAIFDLDQGGARRAE